LWTSSVALRRIEKKKKKIWGWTPLYFSLAKAMSSVKIIGHFGLFYEAFLHHLSIVAAFDFSQMLVLSA
jgi:hypothetical protein